MSTSPFSAIKAITNTLVRVSPLGLYAGSAISGLVFEDFRATLLLLGFIINEAIAYGYKLILQGVYNPQCALMRTEEDYFVLPSSITQTVGFFYGFLLMDMYNQSTFSPWRFFILTVVLIITMFSRINIGCESFLDSIYCAVLGTLLGVGYFNIIKEYYRRDFYKAGATKSASSGDIGLPDFFDFTKQ